VISLLELGPKPSQCERAVPVLTPLVPCDGADPGREVHETYTTLGGVLMLSSRASCSERLDPTGTKELIVVFRNRHGAIDFDHGDERLGMGVISRGGDG